MRSCRRMISRLGLLTLLAIHAAMPALARDESRPIWTPAAGPQPKLNGPAVYGVRPGRPVIYRIPCTGERPISFAADGLPAGLALDATRGIITGQAPPQAGRYPVQLSAKNARGQAERTWTIVVGETLALTPPMGFNDWYTWYDRITQADMIAAADAMIANGMADHGYSYVNIDDCWMIKPGSDDPSLAGEPRDPQTGAIRPNARFPDMKALADAIHERGLKAGLYTSPGPLTCAGFTGSYQHEAEDAAQFAAWGFDFLKYDWCSYGQVASGEGLEHFQKPYRLMGRLLAEQPRDIVLNLCQYGMGDVWTWGASIGGHSWRTTGDLGLERSTRLPGFYSIGLSNARHTQYAGPGGWNDPDYLLIGQVGNAHEMSGPKPSGLTAFEEYSYMSLWCLMAAPLFYSGDIMNLDPFTLNVLCNDELIAIDQDELGRQARIVRQTDDELILAKPLADGSLAVGLFNLSEAERAITATWADLDLTGRQTVRDCWRQIDLEPAENQIEPTAIERHSVRVLRLRAEPGR